MRHAVQEEGGTRYWFEYDGTMQLWIGRITRLGEEVCVVVGSTRSEVTSSARSYCRELRTQAA